MRLLDAIATSDAPVMMNLISTHVAPAPGTTSAAWNNRPTRDDWNKTR
jgi:hypothetical protein